MIESIKITFTTVFENLKNALRSFLKDEKHFSAKVLRSHAQQHYSEEVVGKAFAKLYQSILN